MPDVLGTEGTLFNGVELMKKSCGSGTINTVSLLLGESTYANTSHFFDTDEGEEAEILERRDEIEVVYEYEEEATSVVSLKEESNMTHNLTAMAIGTNYYALHPITFKSLLNDDTCIKNRDYFNSLNHEIKDAHGLNMVLDAQSDAINTTMIVDENLIDGKAHFGALQLVGIPREEEAEDTEGEAEGSTPIQGLAMKEWHKHLVEVDTDFAGTYHIKNNMTLTTFEDEREFEDAWLPCCIGGYLDMPINYQRGTIGFGSNVKAIFDCSCAKLGKGFYER
jgi:hypothetical protein